MLLLLALPGFAGVLVNEVMYNPSGADDGLEWVELCNPGPDPVDLTNYTIESGGASFKKSFTITGGTIEVGGYFLVGSSAGDVTGSFSSNLENGGASADGLRLKAADGTVLDTMLYDGAAGALLDDLGVAGVGAIGVHEGNSLGRWNGTTDCTDTNDSTVDFVEYDAPTPRATNGDPNPPDTGDTGDTGSTSTADCTSLGDLKLNEVLIDADGSDGGKEWVELYNVGSTARDLGGWIVSAASKTTTSVDVELDPGTMIEPGDFLIVGAGGVGSFSSIGNGTGGDAIYLVCGDYLVDAVVYGDDNSDAMYDDFGTAATSLATVPDADVSLARRQDGVDTDLSADDWVASSASTPGAANSTPQCDATGGEGLKVNEVFYDADGSDDGQEFVELYNAGTSPINLEGFTVELATSSWKAAAPFAKGTVLAPGEFLVMGGEAVDNVDVSYTSSIGNGTSGDGVRVLDCTGAVLDTVIYGGNDDDGLEGDGGAVDAVDKVKSGQSIGRYPDGADSDQHTDWFPASPTPGEANIGPDGGGDTDTSTDTANHGGGGNVDPGGCAPDPARPDGAACSTGSLPLHGAELLLVMAALRRRRNVSGA